MVDNDIPIHYVTRSECARTYNEINEKMTRQNLALFGPDGRGGIQNDITNINGDIKDIKTTLLKIEKHMKSDREIKVKSEEISVKRLGLYITLATSIITLIFTPIVNLMVEYIRSVLF